jgi:hypothetical protein
MSSLSQPAASAAAKPEILPHPEERGIGCLCPDLFLDAEAEPSGGPLKGAEADN